MLDIVSYNLTVQGWALTFLKNDSCNYTEFISENVLHHAMTKRYHTYSNATKTKRLQEFFSRPNATFACLSCNKRRLSLKHYWLIIFQIHVYQVIHGKKWVFLKYELKFTLMIVLGKSLFSFIQSGTVSDSQHINIWWLTFSFCGFGLICYLSHTFVPHMNYVR